MPRPVGYGRPGTKVIPDDWAANHGVIVDSTHSGTVALREPGGTPGGWDEEAQQTGTVPHAAYATIPCQVHALAGESRVVLTADDVEIVADYLLTVSRSVDGALEGHLALVTDTGDAALDGKTLEIVRVARGTDRFQRDLYCTLTD